MKEAALAVMAKRPVAGKTKTRLRTALSAKQAAKLYEAMLRDTVQLALQLEQAQLAIAVTPPEAASFIRPLCPADTLFIPAAGLDLGECLEYALSTLALEGYSKVLALNSDGPSLPLSYLRQAVEGLDRADVVLGPSEDGGYYLIGLRSPQPLLFEGISWSTARVAEQTLARARELGLVVALLPPWYDVDRVADLEKLREEMRDLPSTALAHCRRCLADIDRSSEAHDRD
jgi:rSAM/selenodomain-associated transferase 1